MKTRTVSIISSLLFLLAAASAHAARPPREILGVSVGMPYEQSQEKLEKSGRLAGGPLGPLGGKQVWVLEDRRYSTLVVRYNKDQRVEWITAFARVEGPPIRYRDIGNLEKARLQGQYFYSWNQPAAGNRPATVVRAAGTDPERLTSLSLYKLGSAFKEVRSSSDTK
jgi:hypothetical protein